MFVFKNWDYFCSELSKTTLCINAAKAVTSRVPGNYAIIKHDVETNVSKALKLAEIESKYTISATYYVQLYLLNDAENIFLLKKIQNLGHEVTYHYDVLDSNNGNLINAQQEFEYALNKFEDNGFKVKTVCPHGNPIMDRNGWSSNKDFFRNKKIRETYKEITDIVIEVNKFGKEDILYISDAGYGWKLISNIANNDIDNTKPDVKLNGLDDVLNLAKEGRTLIVSAHPHRWSSFAIVVQFRLVVFKILRLIANNISKIPIINKMFSKFYFLAKKI